MRVENGIVQETTLQNHFMSSVGIEEDLKETGEGVTHVDCLHCCRIDLGFISIRATIMLTSVHFFLTTVAV